LNYRCHSSHVGIPALEQAVETLVVAYMHHGEKQKNSDIDVSISKLLINGEKNKIIG